MVFLTTNALTAADPLHKRSICLISIQNVEFLVRT